MGIHLELNPEIMFYIGKIPITDTIVYSWLVIGIIVLGAVILRVAALKAYRCNQEIPSGASNVAEIITGGINSFAKDNLHHHWRPYAPYLGAVALFLAFSNSLGMYGFGLKPPTRDFNLPLALATMTILVVILSGIKYKGLLGFLKTFFKPMWWMFPLNLLEYFAKTVSLTARLGGNILAAFLIMEIIVQVSQTLFSKFYILGPGIPVIFSFYFDIFDGLLQAFVFLFLSTLYIEDVLED